jgi:hypothetical protein
MVHISDEELVRMDHSERATLLARLAALETPPLSITLDERRRHRFVLLSTISTAVLVPWIVGLALTLPHRYVTDRWSQTWVGFDVALVACLAVTTWSGWRRRQLLIPASVVTATLLICDAWFDVMTASTGRDLAVSITSAVLIELPMAALLLSLSRRLVRLTLRIGRLRSGDDGPDQPLRNVPILGVPPASTGPRSATATAVGQESR